ncbi:fimbrial protein TcfA [Shimwellia pseudoproteus]|uniref:fimbria/pilus periplasmic chaperone n=1 Tax=Shimwellia pseudoproteus TaxID=570012 RepID=UPI0018EC4CFE|nr:fimbria/pilus periplasmic chaperone [Shimwellia pseudoproteus]MBJ3813543.1 fimbrial protein TcfA [Shimwellia pseudoproteus]
MNASLIRMTVITSFLFIASSGSSLANMTVYPMSSVIDNSEQEATTLQVLSKSEHTQYVRTVVKRISRPATAFESEQDPQGDPGIIVSPEKFILPAGVTRTVRLISLRSPEKEEAWRVYFEAVPSLDEPEPDSKLEKTKVNVNLIWGVLVRLMPGVQQPEIVRSVDGKELINKGNLRYGVLRVAQCTGASDSSCRWQNVDKSVYPGEALALPAGVSSGAVKIEYRIGKSAPATTILAAGASSSGK